MTSPDSAKLPPKAKHRQAEDLEREFEALARSNEPYMSWLHQVWAILGEETEVLGAAFLLYSTGATPEEAATEIETQW